MNRRWAVLALVFFGILVSYIDRGNLGIAAPPMMQDFRISPATMGVLLSAFFWTYGFFQIPAGALVDKFGIRSSYAAGFLVWSLASAGIAFSRGAGDVIGMRMVLGLAESIGPLASLTFIRKNFAGKDQGLPTSIYIAGQNFGPAIGTLLGTILMASFGWRAMFAITGLGALIWVPCWLALVPRDTAPNEAKAAKDLEEEVVSPRQWTWGALLGSLAFWAMSLSILLSSYYWYFVLTWVPSYLTLARGFTTLEMGRVLSIPLFVMAVVNVAAGSVADKLAARHGVFQTRVLFAACGFVGATSVLLLLVIPDRSWVLPVLTLSMCATGIGNSNFWAISQHAPPRHMVGRSIGYLNTISQAAGVIAPIVTGWLLGPQKQFGTAILVAGLCPVLAGACLLVAGANRLDKMKAMLAGEPLPTI